jgi:hypothetical protein
LFVLYDLQERKHQMKEPTAFFEHFVVVGLRPHSDVQAIEAAFAKKKLWQRDGEKGGFDSVHHKAPTLEPEVTTVTCCKHTLSCLSALGRSCVLSGEKSSVCQLTRCLH